VAADGLVRAHFKNLEVDQRLLTRVENFISIFLAWWVVPLTLLAFWIRFLPRHDWWVTALHVALIAAAAWFGVYSYRLAVRTLSGGATATQEEKRGDHPLPVRISDWRFLDQLLGWRTVRRHLPSGTEAAGAGAATVRVRIRRNVRHYLPGGMAAACAGLAIVVVLSAGAALAPGRDLLTTLGYETYADLTDDDISTKPTGWTGRDETAEVEIAQVKGADLEGRDLRHADAAGAFLVRAILAGADLSDAMLWQTDLRGADLRRAALRRADLWRADLRGASLRGADLRSASLRVTNFSGASFRGADLRGANLAGANLSDASVRGADLRGANLSSVGHLTQAQLDLACGDDKTQLPGRLFAFCGNGWAATDPSNLPTRQL
jgi:Pentapeptide repeats (8 copies)